MKLKITVGIALVMILSIWTGVVTAEIKEIVDTSSLEKGIVSIAYTGDDASIYKVLIAKGEERIIYPFSADGVSETFPLQMGNGVYKIGLLKNTGGSKYAYVTSKTVDLQLEDSTVVYLNSIQNVKWDEADPPILFGETLLKDVSLKRSKVKTLYDHMIVNMDYDYDKIPTLKPDYIPDINSTYAEMKGICYDYSALFASIHRSQGLPVRLVKGYSRFVEGYHAWNEVFLNGKWYILDATVDSTWYGTKITYEMYKDSDDYTKVYDY
ncbi:transglutaminase-like domain-containing protein [Fusibacter tunisiensis]|uniref:Transglutaminase-like putative cysteine protease n=1 Tax=Fusibacter tunisiensis TaxID=1008308 RepID=A0ABS2MQD3_9FIRM|nr:transglutaminase domain-containing protein [Fusibacter tunisiensis]MBM7561590.1 transglutaminase-like putative cysteine protease [Fusibacter tunisiensis]